MSAYVVLQIEVTDAEKLAQYREIATPIVQKYGGRYLARGGRMDVVEGDPLPRIAIVIVEFPSMDAFKQFYDAPEYQAAKALRQSATRGTTLVVEGL
jgi:uncharacterized protein (DUF1330 family)